MSSMLECPVGHYCPSGTTTPTDCPAGTYGPRTKLTASSDCLSCPPGKYCTAGRSTVNGNCDLGYYCRASAVTNTPSGNATNFGLCPAGHYCPAGTGDPIQCHPGTYNPSTGGSTTSDCLNCTQGNYCSQPGLSAVEGACPAGYYCPAGTDVKYPTTQCNRGQYCPQGSHQTTQCAAGTYQNAPRQGYCRQ